MSEQSEDLEALARMAARLAGRDPDEHVTMALGGVIAFKGPLWRYPDFLVRAEAAYETLRGARLECPKHSSAHTAKLSDPSGVGGIRFAAVRLGLLCRKLKQETIVQLSCRRRWKHAEFAS